MIEEYKIPKKIMHSKNFGRKEKLLYAIIDAYCKEYGKCTLSNTDFAELLGIKSNHITKSIKKLKDNNVITTQYKNKTKIEVLNKENYAYYFKEKPKYNIARTIFLNEKILKRRRRKQHG